MVAPDPSRDALMPLHQRNKISQAHQPSPLCFAVCGVEWRRQDQLQTLIPTAFWSDSFGIPKPREV